MKRGIFWAALVVCLSGCAGGPKPLYEWGSYQRDLLQYSKNPGEGKKFADSLMVNIQKAEAANKVPPGLYAEYGYILLDQGDVKAATDYFSKERDRWPESAYLMNGLINRINKTQTDKGAVQ